MASPHPEASRNAEMRAARGVSKCASKRPFRHDEAQPALIGMRARREIEAGGFFRSEWSQTVRPLHKTKRVIERIKEAEFLDFVGVGQAIEIRVPDL